MSLQSECNKNQCSICAKNVRNNSKAVQCDICDLWVHASCEQISNKRYNELSDPENEEVFLNNELPFGLQNDIIFEQTNTLGLNSDSNLETTTTSCDACCIGSETLVKTFQLELDISTR